jgi:hypothetical protein
VAAGRFFMISIDRRICVPSLQVLASLSTTRCVDDEAQGIVFGSIRQGEAVDGC